jgi:hypothetical protein
MPRCARLYPALPGYTRLYLHAEGVPCGKLVNARPHPNPLPQGEGEHRAGIVRNGGRRRSNDALPGTGRQKLPGWFTLFRLGSPGTGWYRIEFFYGGHEGRLTANGREWI